MPTLGLIPARGGSKGIPGKNLISLLGRPLIQWTVEAANVAGLDKVVVSSDDEEIIEAATAVGAQAPFRRPIDLASDQAGTLPVVLHAVEFLKHKGPVVLLQPTSPLRTAEDIKQSLILHQQSCRPVVSVSARKPWLFKMEEDKGLKAVLPIVGHRQSASYVAPNGAIYIADADELMQGKSWWNDPVGYVMPEERSVDIDTPLDLLVAEALLNAQLSPNRIVKR